MNTSDLRVPCLDGNTTTYTCWYNSLLQYPTLHYVISVLKVYVMPVVITCGIVGNVTCVTTIAYSNMRKYACNLYLTAFAIADSLFLLSLIAIWMETVGIRFFHILGICKTIVVFTYILSFLSIWYIVAFTAEIYASVFHNGRCHAFRHPKTAVFVIVLLAVVALTTYAWLFSTLGTTHDSTTNQQHCTTVSWRTQRIVSVLDTVVTLIVPVILLAVMNTRLCIYVIMLNRRKSRLTRELNEISSEAQREFGMSIDSQQALRPSRTNKAPMDTIRLLFGVMTLFVVLNLPSHVVRVQSSLRAIYQPDYHPSETEYLCAQIFMINCHVTYAVNIVVFAVFSRTFRRSLCHMFKEKCCCCYRMCAERAVSNNNHVMS